MPYIPSSNKYTPNSKVQKLFFQVLTAVGQFSSLFLSDFDEITIGRSKLS